MLPLAEFTKACAPSSAQVPGQLLSVQVLQASAGCTGLLAGQICSGELGQLLETLGDALKKEVLLWEPLSHAPPP